MGDDRRYMALALSLGARGLGQVWPNPAVGCVIVKDGRIVGRGRTAPGGRPHAEPQALAQAGAAARGATVYVTLEPCAHFGKTPPCARALIEAGVSRVVSALEDPDPRVDGGGHEMLRAAGIAVETGVMADEARAAQIGFLTRITQGRPMVTLKLASSFDGRIATAAGESQWITGPGARRMVHAMRMSHDAVLVGGGTARADDPMLTVRGMGATRDVRDALEREAREAGARVLCDAPVVGVEPSGSEWIAHLADGRRLVCPALLLCPGGQSYPRTGTTGDGYAWLRALDLPLVDPVPALVPLRSPETWVHELTGIAVQEVEARLFDPGGKVRARRRRPVLFTHRGLSGPAAMDLSERVARDPEGLFQVSLDLAPDMEREELRGRLVEAAGRAGKGRAAAAMGEPLPRRLLAAVARQAGLEAEDPRAHELSKPERHRFIEAWKGLRVPVRGTLGYEAAEVTAGGLDLRAVHPRTMEVRGYPGLYVFGELLDLAGPIGGLNFQAAFATAELAAEAAADRVHS